MNRHLARALARVGLYPETHPAHSLTEEKPEPNELLEVMLISGGLALFGVIAYIAGACTLGGFHP